MNKPITALFLYVGLAFFFVVNALSILRGLPILTGVVKGLLALAIFAALGLVAGVAARQEKEDEPEDDSEAEPSASQAVEESVP
jgi:hypothetical protein